ncbi:hypothetical protein E2C01_059245 [Portunus trituberculatus]|uniref:Secreted protein n=1 Tax=Portunus trituberculatus TaxID=210409 RepID=A0A5B7H717_PORTR|nr:hypothetical protein [Portunus trituberculatus]
MGRPMGCHMMRLVGLYLLSCIVQSSSWAHSVLSPYLHLSSFSLKLCTLCAVTISLSNAFHFSPFCVENCIFQYPSPLPHPYLSSFMSSCPSIFFRQQHQVFFVCVFNITCYLIHC